MIARRIVRTAAALLALFLFGCGLLMLVRGWDYFYLPAEQQAIHPEDGFWRSSGQLGTLLGIVAATLMGLNLLYILRRNLFLAVDSLGSLRSWMTFHVVTGLAAPLAALLHSAFFFRSALGIAVFSTLVLTALMGVVGRYLYSATPRGSTGQELALAQVESRAAQQLAALQDRLASRPKLLRQLEQAVAQYQPEELTGRFLPIRVAVLLWGRVDRWRATLALRRRLAGEPDRRQLTSVIERLWRLRLQVARHGELKRLMASWRVLHRWLALAAVMFLLGHIFVALRYARLWGGRGIPGWP